MGRPPRNKFEKTYLAFDEKTTIRVFDIKIPFVYKFTVTPVDQEGFIEWEYHIKKSEDVPIVTEDLKKKDYEVVKIEPAVRKMIDLCPRCTMRGTPKIEKKDAHDRRTRRPRHLEEMVETNKNEIKSERPEEYWLVYSHSKHKKCRIRQYVNTPDPAYKYNDIAIEEYFFPRVLEHLKEGSLRYAN